MTKELQEFETWMGGFSNEQTLWVTHYFHKNGISNDNVITSINIKEDILDQASRYFSALDDKSKRQRNLAKMQRSWSQYQRRQKLPKKELSITVNKDVHNVLNKIKKDGDLDNLSQSIESLINNSAFRREILRLERSNHSLKRRLERIENNNKKYNDQKKEIEVMKKRIESLDERNLILSYVIEELMNQLASKKLDAINV
ncbi:TPA: hypothetical protein KDY13_002779 [Vibrio parahaemolyticus]|nr:hypothetical protein [Vibrio parahaemolyticus]